MASQKQHLPDSKYNNVLVTRFIGHLIEGGKRSKAESVVYSSLEIIKEKTKKDPLDVLDEAMRNVAPSLEVKAKRVGGANYQVPMPVIGERRNTLAIRWILNAARSKKGKPTGVALALEIMDAAKRQGAAVKRREDVHRMAEANKAFAHFA